SRPLTARGCVRISGIPSTSGTDGNGLVAHHVSALDPAIGLGAFREQPQRHLARAAGRALVQSQIRPMPVQPRPVPAPEPTPSYPVSAKGTRWEAVNCPIGSSNIYDDCEVLAHPGSYRAAEFPSKELCMEWISGRSVPRVRMNKGRTYNTCIEE